MTKHRFFISPENIIDRRVIFPKDLQSQISRVLRLKPGDEVEVLDNKGETFLVRLVNEPDLTFSGEIISSKPEQTDPRVHLTLFFGLTQREKLEWILQKGTEIGISEFQPFISRRTLVQQGERAEKHQARWDAILREASEQCGRGRIPELFRPLKFTDAIKVSLASCGLVIAAWEEETVNDLKAVLGINKPASVGLFCGPEGGFDPVEIDLMHNAGIQFFSLGNRILRMETAAMIAPALVLYELGEMAVSKKPNF